MTAPAKRFTVGVNYWPGRTATAMWEQFDAGEIREDFSRIAGFGLDTVRFFLRWDAFQPRADAVDPIMLGRLEQIIGIAADYGLQAIPTLFCGHMHGVNWLPAWVLDRKHAARIPTYVGNTPSPFAAGDTYGGALLEAQLVLARAVGERLAPHPAVAAVDIGNAFSEVREPLHTKISSGDHGAASAAEPYVAQWTQRLQSVLAETSGKPVTAGTFSGDLTRDRDIRLGSLCAPLAFASMQGSTVHCSFARNRLDSEVVPFLAMLTAGFSYKPVLVSGFGNPTCPANKLALYERFPEATEPPLEIIRNDDPVLASFPCLSEEENALYCTRVLERLHADGRLGALWWCWSDYPAAVSPAAPFERMPHERTYGIVRSDGSEKPVARALANFAGQQRTVLEAHEMPMISSTYYYRTLPISAKTLFDAFLGFVEARRSSAT